MITTIEFSNVAMLSMLPSKVFAAKRMLPPVGLDLMITGSGV